MSELFGPPFCISILKVLLIQILHDSLDYNAFCMIQEYFSQGLEFSRNQRPRPLFFWENLFAECLNYLVPPAVFNL